MFTKSCLVYFFILINGISVFTYAMEGKNDFTHREVHPVKAVSFEPNNLGVGWVYFDSEEKPSDQLPNARYFDVAGKKIIKYSAAQEKVDQEKVVYALLEAQIKLQWY